VAMIAFHIYLVRAHGVAEEEENPSPSPGTPGEGRGEGSPVPRESVARDESRADPLPEHRERGQEHERVYRFFPEHLWRSSIVFVGVFLILLGLSLWAHIPREPVAGTLVDSYLPRPEWYYMWLFQLLTLFPGKLEWVGSLVIPMLGVSLLFLLPFLGKPRSPMGVRNRPIPLAIGSTVIVAIAYLTCMGFAGAKPYGETIRVPDRQLTPSEQRGLYLYADRQCAYCHQIEGTGGHRVGPDLSNEVAKHHEVDYLMRYIHDPRSVNRTSIMPKYDLPEADLRALADFIRSLDFSKATAKTVTREQAMGERKELATDGAQMNTDKDK
jgi:quinol-cytochrome oxidoreductase complex cytochrome b subunit